MVLLSAASVWRVRLTVRTGYACSLLQSAALRARGTGPIGQMLGCPYGIRGPALWRTGWASSQRWPARRRRGRSEKWPSTTCPCWSIARLAASPAAVQAAVGLVHVPAFADWAPNASRRLAQKRQAAPEQQNLRKPGQSTMSARRVISSRSPTVGMKISSSAPMSAYAATVSLTRPGPAATPSVMRRAISPPEML
jgi:hypothetical protein